MPKLPTGMRYQHGAFYHIRNRKWTRLSTDYADALRLYAGLVAPNSDRLPDMIDRWLSSRQLSDKPFAAKTFHTYSMIANRLKTAFVEFRPQDVKAAHLYQLIAAKHISTAMAGHYRSVMIGVMQMAVEEGLIDRNLIREVKNYTSKTRGRYIRDAEFKAIWNKATPTLRAIMDIAYLTGQRIGDVLAIKIADIVEEGIIVVQQKTKTRLCIALTPDLTDAIARAKELHTTVKGFTLLHSRRGSPFTYSTVRTMWDRACEYAGVEDAHLHDLRAKAATDAGKQGIDSKALLGHKSEAVHLRYIRDKETPIVQPVALRK